MKELEIKHLSAYLSYRLKYIDKDSGKIETMRSIGTEINLVDMGWGNAHELSEFKPILRPLSDLLDKENEAIIDIYNKSWMSGGFMFETDENGIHLLSKEDESSICISLEKPQTNIYWVNEILLEHHYDLFGLIEKGLAIDKKTI